MKKLQYVLFLILIILVSYITMEKSGMITYFNTMINQEDGWVKHNNGYSRTYIETSYNVSFSLLKDPEKNGFNIYEGAMKKTAVDRMELVTIIAIKVSDIAHITDIVTTQAKKFKCNTAILNGITTSNRTISEAFAL